MKQVWLCLFLLCLIGCTKPLPVLGEVPDFSLSDQEGNPFEKKDLEEKIWVANFIFTHCTDICPALTEKMAILEEFPTLQLVSFSVDPERDSPTILKQYADQHGAGQDWHFLTGQAEEMERLVVDGLKIPFGKNHADKFLLIDSKGRIRGYYSASDFEQLKKGIKTLL